ncbi:MAG: O-antigen ligase family protein [Candidatus Eremiobacteraeota bacterium]|nr:O-antigen ligase family protein [Candidatus Eremiobacteraeota bacterium]
MSLTVGSLRGTTSLDRLCPSLLFFLALTLPLARIPFPSSNSVLPGQDLQLFDLIVCLSAVTAILCFMFRPNFRHLVPLLYPIALAVSASVSENPGQSVIPLAKAIYLSGLACLVQVFLNRSPQKGRRWLRWGWLAGLTLTCFCIILGVIGFYSGCDTQQTNPFLFHYGSIKAGHFPRVCATFFNANLLCNYLLVSLAWLKSARARALVALCSLATLSPGLGPLFLLFLWDFKSRPSRIAGTVIALTMYLLTWTYPNDLFQGHFRASGRVECWRQSTNLWLQSPLLGQGPGQAWVLVRWQAPDGAIGTLTDPHNTSLSLLSQGGVLLMAVVISVFLTNRANCDRELFKAILLAFWLDGLTGSFEDARHIWVAIGALGLFPAAAGSEGGHNCQK